MKKVNHVRPLVCQHGQKKRQAKNQSVLSVSVQTVGLRSVWCRQWRLVVCFHKVPVAFFAAAIILGVFASCASAPQRGVDYTDASREFGVLDGGALAYFFVDVPAARPILDQVSLGGTSGKQAAQILDRTKTAVGAIYPAESGRRYLLSAQGRYPRSGANLALGMNASWKKQRSGGGLKYWHSDGYGISLRIEPRHALVSDGELFAPPGRVTVPEAFWEMREGAVMAGWLGDAAALINQLLAGMEIPVQVPADNLIFAVFPAGFPLPAYSAGTSPAPGFLPSNGCLGKGRSNEP